MIYNVENHVDSHHTLSTQQSTEAEPTKKANVKKSSVSKVKNLPRKGICFWLGANRGEEEIPKYRSPEGVKELLDAEVCQGQDW